MLIRHTTDETFEVTPQEHHAMLSGMLAQAWAQCHLHPALSSAITLHDAPWRDVDAEPLFNPETGLPHDFIDYPMDEKISFYRRGIDHLERVHPYVAYMVSLHYTTFAGTKGVERLQAPERERRERLEARLDESFASGAERALEWVKFFDVFSLHLCLTGPRAVDEAIPRWLRDSSAWSTAPDGTDLTLGWSDARTLEVSPWPFDKAELTFDLHHRVLRQRADNPDALRSSWDEADLSRRPLRLTTSDR